MLRSGVLADAPLVAVAGPLGDVSADALPVVVTGPAVGLPWCAGTVARFVDATITVVVDAITASVAATAVLGLTGNQGAVQQNRMRHVTREHAVHTGAGSLSGALLVAALHANVDSSFVGVTIAVVVEAIADLHTTVGFDATGVAVGFVDVAVTVVVTVVAADFILRFARGGVAGELAVGAELMTGTLTDASTHDAVGRTLGLEGRVFVGGTVAVAVHTVADVRGKIPAPATGVLDTLVDLAVAIVVGTVTDLVGHVTAPAAGVLDTFIDLAVAVVVAVVAEFHRIRTALAACVRDALVNGTVAVVVQRVADLVGRLT